MTPVEATSTCSAGIPRTAAAAFASRTAFSIPEKNERASAMCYVALGIVVMLIGYSGQTISRFVTLLIVCLQFAIVRSYATRN